MKRRSVLADTGPIYAAADSSDQHHRRAVAELAALQDDGYSIVVLHPTLMEAYSLVLRQLGVKFSLGWLRAVSERVGLLNPAPEDSLAAILRLGKYPDQRISLFDAVLVVVGERLNVPVWTFDADFDIMGARVWRPA